MIADLGLKAISLMDYSGVNAGWNELSVGSDFLEKITSAPALPLITSNLVHKDTRLPLGKKYVIKRVGDVKVGIIGIMPTEQPKSRAYKSCGQRSNPDKPAEKPEQGTPFTLLMEHLEVIPPEKALKELLPQVREQADIVVLLSQYRREETTEIVNNIKGIDLAISLRGKTRKRADENKGTPVMETAYRSLRLGYVKLTLDEAGKIIQNQKKMIRLNKSVASDKQIAQITGDDINKKVREAEIRKRKEEARALLKMSPYEYYEMVTKQQAERIKN